ncbi:RHS repeat-associated core domain-containing protein [Anaeromyxobacter sp. K]|uniref:NHL domain-containing protein n=1 Tax=Anaeromyxobacter sp. (strain K) TaxID=447217 RepID=UPI0012F7B88B|nr:RHS repeat-associated core domain-containing protein [Anaeromyxobacter sp. K]
MASRGTNTFACALPDGAIGPFRLLVRNGDETGSARASSALVRVNGTDVLAPRTFDQQVQAATARLTLSASNAVEAQVNSAGGMLGIEIVDEGRACTILSAIDVAQTRWAGTAASANAQSLPELQLFNGGLDARSPTTKALVELDGAPVISREDVREKISAVLWSVRLAAPSTLSAVAGAKGSFAIQIVDRDERAPMITIDSAADGAFTNQAGFRIAGAIDDPSATVSIDGVPARLDGGRYEGTAALGACWNTIAVTAADVCGNARTSSIRVGLDTSKPVLAIVSPANGTVSGLAAHPLTLRYSDDFSGIALSTLVASVDGTDVTGSLIVGPDIATGLLTLTEGEHIVRARLTDRAGNAAQQESHLVVDLSPPTLEVVTPPDGSSVAKSSVAVTVTYADALSGVVPTTLAIRLDGEDVTSRFAAGPVSAAGAFSLERGEHHLAVSISDAVGNVASARSTFGVTGAGNGLPPDPAQVAPPNDETVATDIAASTRFLYTGDDAIQTGVSPGTIEPDRVGIVRGRVIARGGTGIGGARVAITGHPEFGSTLTRADGRFDLAVNGGGDLTVSYQKDGFLPAHRQVSVPWRDYVWAEPVALVPFDVAVSSIQSGAAALQVARGSAVTDGDGTRRTTILFPAGTQAAALLADGSLLQLSTFHVRATEYTVGSAGRAAMPAPLPPSVAYTYAVELSVDEAVMAGARGVVFSRPVPVYLENFLGVPVGRNVPAGYYDRERAAWMPSDDGRVLRVLSTDGGVASIDANGDGAEDSPSELAALAISADELSALAATYRAGETLWRVLVPHFSAWDFNYGWGCEPDSDGMACEPPDSEPLIGSGPDPDPDLTCGSIIECQTQALGEREPVTGTPYHLSYRSMRQLGRKAERQITIPIPKRLSSRALGLVYEVHVAGQRLTQRVPASQPGAVTYVWDGRDGYGRPYQGSAPVLVRVGFVYRPIYASVALASGGRTFASGTHGSTFGVLARYDQCGDQCFPPDGTPLLAGELVAWRVWTGTLSAWSSAADGLGGWTLSPHHVYDPVAKVVWRGDGTVQAATILDSQVITTHAKTGWPVGMAIAPDGNIYTAEDWVVKRTDRAGRVDVIAGGGPCTAPQSGIPASRACLRSVYDLALGPDGSIYLAGTNSANASPVRRIRPDGIIEDVAGMHGTPSGPFVEEIPALSARIGFASGVAATPDGSVFILADDRIRKVTPDGIIHAFAGTGAYCCRYGACGTCCYGGDDGPAVSAQICGGGSYGKVAVGPDGSVYLTAAAHDAIRRVRPDGIIERFAGLSSGFGGDGGPARFAKLRGPNGVSVGPDGSVYIADTYNARIRRVDPSGIIESIAGSGFAQPQFWGDGGPALAARLNGTWQAVVAPDGDLFIADSFNARIRRVGAARPGFTIGEIAIASADGREIYVFSGSGRHLRTIDARTLVVVHSFAYDDAGRLSTVTDRDGQVTRIERGGGVPTAIVAPHGQRTALTVDANGYLASIVNPKGESRHYVYDANGLMQTYMDPRGLAHAFEHDALGRLVLDTNPAGGSKTLSRTDRPGGYAVSVTTALGRTTVHDVQGVSAGQEVRTLTRPDGTGTTTTASARGERTTSASDGTSTAETLGPDPQFGMQSPLAATNAVILPSGLTRQHSRTASVVLQDPADPFSVTSRSDRVTVNGRTTTSTYDVVTRTIVTTSAAGRKRTTVLDALGRPATLQLPGIERLAFQHDSSGRLQAVVQGTRIATLEYDSAGRPWRVTDPIGRTTELRYDAGDQVVSQVLPDGRTVGLDHDASGNLTSVTPPGRPPHGFDHGPADLLSAYTPPFAPATDLLATGYAYDLDGDLAQVLLPDRNAIVFGRDPAGRLSSLTTQYGTSSVGYDTSGRLASIVTHDGPSLSWTYDGHLPSSETTTGESVTGIVGWSYDNDFRIATSAVNGVPVSYQYDADGLLTYAGALRIARDPSTGMISGTTLGSVSTSAGYDAYGDLERFAASAGGISAYAYAVSRDASGRITGKSETIQGTTATWVYGYDDAGRLTTVRRDGRQVASYGYDDNGNRLLRTIERGTESGSYDDQDRLATYGGYTFSYGANGELASRSAGGRTTWYDYDPLGNLRAVRLPDGALLEYVVDGLNRRVGKKVNGAQLEGFLYEGQLRPVAWLDGSGQVYARFVYGLHVNVPEYMVTAAGTFRFLTDHLGSPRLVVNASTGAVVQRIDYDEWGQVLADSNPGFQPFGFAGGLYDRDTGLVRFGARDYDPTVGRWTAKDRSRFRGGLNFYEYAASDPVNFVDPTGNYFAPPPAAGVGIGAMSLNWVTGAGIAFAGGWLAGTWLNQYITDHVQVALDYYLGPADGQFWAVKPDLKQVNDIARVYHLEDDERQEFGRFLEDEKACGRGGTTNDRGDFTWKELNDKIRDFLGIE